MGRKARFLEFVINTLKEMESNGELPFQYSVELVVKNDAVGKVDCYSEVYIDCSFRKLRNLGIWLKQKDYPDKESLKNQIHFMLSQHIAQAENEINEIFES